MVPVVCTQRYCTPRLRTGLQARECGTGKINPASDLLGAQTGCNEHQARWFNLSTPSKGSPSSWAACTERCLRGVKSSVIPLQKLASGCEWQLREWQVYSNMVYFDLLVVWCRLIYISPSEVRPRLFKAPPRANYEPQFLESSIFEYLSLLAASGLIYIDNYPMGTNIRLKTGKHTNKHNQ